MKVLFLAEWYPNKMDGQSGVFVRKHALAVAQYCEVNLLYTHHDSLLDKPYVIEKNKAGNFSEWVVYYRGSNLQLLNIFIALRIYKQMLALIRKENGMEDLQHIQIMGKKNAVITTWQQGKYGIPYIITEHWTGYINGKFEKKGFREKYIIRKAIKKAKAITTVSVHLKNAMLKLGLNNNYMIIPNVVQASLKQTEPGKASEKKIFLTVSDLVDANKNISGTIKAVASIVKTRTDFEFHIIGGGADEEMLRKLASDLNLLNTKVFFHGRKVNEYVLEFLNKIDFVVVNSNVETFSVIAAEALATGKPVIATICGGPEDFITDKTGILIEKGNSTQLEAALLNMLDNYKYFNKQLMKDSVNEKFGAASIGKQFYDLYKEVLKDR